MGLQNTIDKAVERPADAVLDHGQQVADQVVKQVGDTIKGVIAGLQDTVRQVPGDFDGFSIKIGPIIIPAFPITLHKRPDPGAAK